MATNLTSPTADDPATAYLLRLTTATSRRSQAAALQTLVGLATGQDGIDPRVFPWPVLDYPRTLALRAALAARFAPATVNRHLAALRGVLREAWRLGLTTAEAFQRATDLKPIGGSAALRGRAIDSGELAALFEAVRRQRHEATRLRDAAMLAVLYAAGLRRAEVVGLDLGDYDHEGGRLVVHGKGRKVRVVFIRNGAHAALGEWLHLRGGLAGPLLVPVGKSGRIVLRRLTTQAVYSRLKALAVEAKLRNPISPHDFRRSCISDLLDRGVDLATVQRLAGHSSPATTGRYDRRDERSQQRAAETLHIPW